MALRSRKAIRVAEDAYARLDAALAAGDRSSDRLAAANEELREANVQLRATQIALACAEPRRRAKPRTDARADRGTGEELAELLARELEPSRRR